jgi:hypothetical protein
MRAPRSSRLHTLCLVLSVAAVAGCGQAGPLATSAALRRPAAPALSRVGDGDAGLVKALALEAHGELAALNATYAELKLNTPGGRRFTPEQEARVREGLQPAIARLDQAATAIADRLREESRTSRVQAFAARFQALAPVTGADPATATTSTGLLFRGGQYRVKLGAVIDFALEQGLLTELPATSPVDRARKR